ncbi:MAG: 3-phosphoglycerate dehydrogenase [Bacilli bacterium]|nr:3-phosphoglycerate dehydrogenase [Bacilli bacterium]
MKAYCLNKISSVALATLKAPDTTVSDINDADSILVRSQNMAEMELGKNILAVARAGAGVNNIPIEEYAKKGVVVFNTPGANANAVKELVLCGLLLSSRDIIGGNKWVNEHKDDEAIAKDAEKAKKEFAGHEIYGKTIAIIGLGVIGVMVANACQGLGMKVRGYDPYLTINNAMKLSKDIVYFESIEEAVDGVDFVSIHVPLSEKTKGMINKDIFAKLNGATLVNFARDALVNEDDLVDALSKGEVRKYVSDFANPRVVNLPNAIILPHLGASTEEAEDNCAMMAIDELKDYIENGNITHSVNYPDVHVGPKEGFNRVCVLHKNIPGAITKITSTILDYNSNIISFANKSKGEYAYSIFDVEGKVDENRISEIDGIIRVRII